MSITDQALKKLYMGLEREWSSHATMRSRAVEIIESLAKQLEAKGDHSEEYKRGFRDGIKHFHDLQAEKIVKEHELRLTPEPILISQAEIPLYIQQQELYDKCRNGNEPKPSCEHCHYKVTILYGTAKECKTCKDFSNYKSRWDR